MLNDCPSLAISVHERASGSSNAPVSSDDEPPQALSAKHAANKGDNFINKPVGVFISTLEVWQSNKRFAGRDNQSLGVQRELFTRSPSDAMAEP
jgi:hypothetical protein